MFTHNITLLGDERKLERVYTSKSVNSYGIFYVMHEFSLMLLDAHEAFMSLMRDLKKNHEVPKIVIDIGIKMYNDNFIKTFTIMKNSLYIEILAKYDYDFHKQFDDFMKSNKWECVYSPSRKTICIE